MNSKITAEKFNDIKKKYGHYSSWAVWNLSPKMDTSNMDTKVFDNISILNQLHVKYILVALNISRPIQTPFGNFHPTYSVAKDFKTRFALLNTPLWGSYMTDIIKDFEEVSSGKMRQYLKLNPNFEKENIKSFLNEINYIGAIEPTLIAIGEDSYKILKRNLKENYKIIKIPHYANYNSKENYRKLVLSEIEKLI
jgi:hypothetical protein